MAMSRLRARYREVLRAQIAQTVTSEAEVEDEVCTPFQRVWLTVTPVQDFTIFLAHSALKLPGDFHRLLLKNG